MDNILSSEDAGRYIRKLGLTVGEEVVRRVVSVLKGVDKEYPGLYRLYKKKPSVCGKGTVYKIKRLFDMGKLDPYWAFVSQYQTNTGSQQPADKVAGPLTDAHLEQRAVPEAKATTGTVQLSNRTKEKSDPLIIAKAKEEHLAEVGLLLREWKSQLGRAHIDGGWLRRLPNNFLGAENKQLFPFVIDHCPSVSEKYLPFKNLRECYKKKWEALVTEIGLMAPGSNE